MRHGGRAAAAVRGWFKEFANFGLRVKRNVAGDFAQSSREKPERGSNFTHAVAMAVPGECRQRKLQFFGEIGGDVQAARAEGCHGTDGAAELKHEAAFLRFREPRAMTVDRVEPASDFEAERCGKRLLHPGAGDDKSGAILVDQFAEDDGEEIEFG